MKDIVFTGKAYTDFIEWSKTDRKIFEKIISCKYHYQ
jgi:hypothetical protein